VLGRGVFKNTIGTKETGNLLYIVEDYSQKCEKSTVNKIYAKTASSLRVGGILLSYRGCIGRPEPRTIAQVRGKKKKLGNGSKAGASSQTGPEPGQSTCARNVLIQISLGWALEEEFVNRGRPLNGCPSRKAAGSPGGGKGIQRPYGKNSARGTAGTGLTMAGLEPERLVLSSNVIHPESTKLLGKKLTVETKFMS